MIYSCHVSSKVRPIASAPQDLYKLHLYNRELPLILWSEWRRVNIFVSSWVSATTSKYCFATVESRRLPCCSFNFSKLRQTHYSYCKVLETFFQQSCHIFKQSDKLVVRKRSTKCLSCRCLLAQPTVQLCDNQPNPCPSIQLPAPRDPLWRRAAAAGFVKTKMGKGC